MNDSRDTRVRTAFLLEILSTEILENTPDLDERTDLFEAGMDSLGTMQLLVRIEQRFGLQLPAAMLTKENASTVTGLVGLMDEADLRKE
jgi:acyl carrier protein